MYDDLTPQLALQNAPSEKARALMRQQFIASGVLKPDGLSSTESAQLEALKTQMAESNVEARHLQAHGGQQSIDTQNRIAASWLAGNVHSQGKQE